MNNIKILWIDDEIDLLKVQILFLEEKGYSVATANNAEDGFDMIQNTNYDIVFLDENMSGLSGVQILPKIKTFAPALPVIMVTKREEEELMEDAIGSKVDGYLIKPVNPNQILLTIKQKVHNKKIISEKTAQKYQTVFKELSDEIYIAKTFENWVEIYKKLVYWQLELENTELYQLKEILYEQKTEANRGFSKFIQSNYPKWHKDTDNKPLMLNELLRNKVLPAVKSSKKIFLIVIDNLRLDQWKILKPTFKKYLNLINEEVVSSILPTTTQYARNAFFAGLTPLDISKRYPQFWKEEAEEGNKNDFEEDLIRNFFSRNRQNIKISFHKILNEDFAKNKFTNVKGLLSNDLNVFVFNFVDMLSHAKTNLQMVKDLAKDEDAYRSLVTIWFKDSFLQNLVEELSDEGVTVFITTDHGSVCVKNPLKIIGDRESSTNIRYKQGKNLNFDSKELFEIRNPNDIGLPKTNISSTFVFSQNNDFLVYPKKFHHYSKYYKDTFQHGGISMEEMLIPFIELESKSKKQ